MNQNEKGEEIDLKRLVADPSKCTGCGICEKICSKAYYKEAVKDKSAIRIGTDEQGAFTISVCDQCGACLRMCTMMSLAKSRTGSIRLNKKTCVGCLICVAECKRGYMYYHNDLPTPFKCIACGLCAKQCPAGALSIYNDD